MGPLIFLNFNSKTQRDVFLHLKFPILKITEICLKSRKLWKKGQNKAQNSCFSAKIGLFRLFLMDFKLICGILRQIRAREERKPLFIFNFWGSWEIYYEILVKTRYFREKTHHTRISFGQRLLNWDHQNKSYQNSELWGLIAEIMSVIKKILVKKRQLC